MGAEPKTFAELCDDVRSAREENQHAADVLKLAQEASDVAYSKLGKAQRALGEHVDALTGLQPIVEPCAFPSLPAILDQLPEPTTAVICGNLGLPSNRQSSLHVARAMHSLGYEMAKKHSLLDSKVSEIWIKRAAA